MPDAWRPAPPAAPALGAAQVHVWRASLEPAPHLLARLSAILSPDERERAARFRMDVHRNRYAAGRGILRVLTGAYTGTPPAAVRFGHTAHGKPFLAGHEGRSDGLRFNMTNAEAMGLFAFAWGRHLGVDLENLKPMPDALSIATRFFSAPENEVFAAVPAEERELAFFTCWTRKEAYVKAVGEGLSMPLDRFDVTLHPAQPARLLATRPDPAEAERWSLHHLDPGPGWIGALMAEGSDCTPSLWDWSGEYLG
jgi:4'-phosphopantetheinyl transferase